MKSSWPEASILKEYPHYYVLAPRSFTCGYTERAVEMIIKMKRPVLKYKSDDLDSIPMPAFDKRPFMPMEELAEKRNPCIIVPGNPNFQQAKQVAQEMTQGWPQIYLFVPSIQKYVYIKDMSVVASRSQLLAAIFDGEIKKQTQRS